MFRKPAVRLFLSSAYSRVGTIDNITCEGTQVEWQIHDFLSAVTDIFSEDLESPVFQCADSLWYLRLVAEPNTFDPIFLRIYLVCDDHYDYSVEVSFGLKKLDGSIKQFGKGVLNGESIVISAPLNLSDVRKRKSELLPSNALIVTCTLKRKTVVIGDISSEKLLSIEELHKEFHNPKSIIFQLLNEAFLKDQTLDIKPSITVEQIQNDSDKEIIWQANLKMKWPEHFEVESMARKKSDAINNCYLYACSKLKQMGVLDNTNKPCLQKRKYNEQEVKSAKSDLINLYHKIWHRFGNKEYMPKFKSKLVQGLYGSFWQTELCLSYPEKITFKAVSLRSTTAECIAAHEALLWLIDKGVINRKRRLLEYSKSDEMKLKAHHEMPYSICIPTDLQEKMQNVLADIEQQKLLLSSEGLNDFKDFMEGESRNETIKDLITDNPYYKLTDQQSYDRSRYLYEKNKNLEKKYMHILADIQKVKSSLPIFEKRKNILKLIDENQVVVLSGDTGCGKSTQVPQFILDHYIENMKGSQCNIVVTQPRRISAYALAERVARERDERVGETVGFQIRFNKMLPQGNGAILYCTTGMLLRKILSNPNLDGISHIIIDEIHERNIQIDLVCILLKNFLEHNKNIKLLLMSASFNTSLFANYFNTSAVIHIPGKMYPVEEYFLEDLEDKIPGVKIEQTIDSKQVNFDADLIVNTINYIDENELPGAILCFLPGWHEIRTVQTKLLENEDSSEKFFICPLHSRLPHNQQKNIFSKPSEGQRKIILATNIAETSITVSDVVYVINSGLQKETKLDTQIGIASLSTEWITKANVRQRKGRAGRVKPGKCYHLFSWKTFMKMEEYPLAEILRIPLEKVILDCKLYCPESKPEEFLSKALQPPAIGAIQNGINELQLLGVLDENESLTDLGNTIVGFSTHPRLSVALVYSTFLRCLDPILTISSLLTIENEPFANNLDDQVQIRNIKKMHDDNGLCSDHLALRRIYDTWNSLEEENEISEYINKNLLDVQSLERVKQLKELFAADLHSSNLIYDPDSYSDTSSYLNEYSSHVPTILSVLAAAFYPNVIKILQGEISQGKLNKYNLIYSIIKGQKAFIQKGSVASSAEELPSPWLVYFSALNSEARRKAMISAVSATPGISLLLMAGKDLTMSHMPKEDTSEENFAVLSIDNYDKLKFSCTDKEARLLLDWRECLFEIFRMYTETLKGNCGRKECMIACYEKFIPVLKELLETPQVPFTKGQSYQFVNNELIAEDL